MSALTQALQRQKSYAIHYDIDGLSFIDELIALAGICEHLLDCAAEFEGNMTCCSELFQAIDDQLAILRNGVKDVR